MATMVDIMISSVLGGVLFIIALNTNDIASENAFIYNGDLYVQQTLTAIVPVIENDFRHMGFGVPEGVPTVVSADSHSISFKVDFNQNGTIDTVSYWAGPLSDLAYTQNDSDRVLYRKVKPGSVGEVLSAGEDLTIPQGIGFVTKFDLAYFSQSLIDTLLSPVPQFDLKLIKVLQITLEVQNPFAPYKKTVVQAGEQTGLFSSTLWRQTRLASRNLTR